MKFTIITVCLNSAKTIRRTLDSVLQQKYQDYELLVIDGVSTDGTVEIIKEYEPEFHGRMRWISEKDDGIYFAMNKGISMAKGEYLDFLNSDDYFEKNTLETVATYIQKYPGFNVYYGFTSFRDKEGKEVFIQRANHEHISDGLANREYMCILSHPSMWYSAECFKKVGIFNTVYKIAADFDHCVKMYKTGLTFQPIDAVVVNFTLGGFSSWDHDLLQEENHRIYHAYGYMSDQELKQYFRDQAWNGIKHKVKMFLRRLLHA